MASLVAFEMELLELCQWLLLPSVIPLEEIHLAPPSATVEFVDESLTTTGRPKSPDVDASSALLTAPIAALNSLELIINCFISMMAMHTTAT